MNARQQLARLLPLAVLVLLALVGLRGGISWDGKLDGPLRQYGVIIGIALEVVLAALLITTFYRERAVGGGRHGAPAGADDAGERDVAGALRALLRLLLGVAMAGVAIVIVVGLHLHSFAKPAQHATLPHLPVHPTTKAVPAGSSGGAALDIPLKPILYALVVVALLAALVVSAWWARRLSQAVVLPAALPEGRPEEELREAVASGRAAMAALDDARAAIIACYEAMEQSLAQRGAARSVAGTPDELLRQVTSQKIITGTGARRLTTLFYEARFSTHHLGPGTREAAVAALDDLAAELSAPEPGEVTAGGASEPA